jgi:hypothetical protein
MRRDRTGGVHTFAALATTTRSHASREVFSYCLWRRALGERPPIALKANPSAGHLTRSLKAASPHRGERCICCAGENHRSNPMTEDEFAAEVMRRFKGRIVLALGAAGAIGFVLGAMVF